MTDREPNEIDDEQLRARFAALRHVDSRSEPDFRSMLERSQSHALTPSRALGLGFRWAAVAASVVLAVAALVSTTRHRSSPSTAVSAATVSGEWQPPTAGLLNTHVRGLMAPPSLLSSVFDSVVPPTLQQVSE